MPIRFDKRLSQVYCQDIAERQRLAAPNNKYNFKDYQLTADDSLELISKVKKDAVGLYYNALVSFIHGCRSVIVGCVSWACVELYYSLFYALRAELYFNGYALIRDWGRLYLVKIANGEHPMTKNNKKEYNTDHGGSLRYFIDIYGTSDYLCSNMIDGMNVYLWMMDLRETTNYRHDCFNEPECFAELIPLVTKVKTIGIADVLRGFKSDFGTFCFSDQYAWLCAPYRKLLEVAAKYKAGTEKLTAEQLEYLDSELRGLGMSEVEVKELIGELKNETDEEDEDDMEFVI